MLIVLLDKSKDTSSRLEALRQYVTNDFLYANPDSAIQIAKMGIDLAEKAEFKNEIAFGFYCLGVANNYLGKTDDAIRYQNQSLEISKGIKDTTMMTKALNNLGNIYLNNSDFGKAIDCYQTCQKLLEEKENERGVAVCKNNIGLVFYDLEDYEQALIYLNGALDIYKNLGSENKVYESIGNYKEAMEMQMMFRELRDSIHSEKNHLAVLKSEYKFNQERKIKIEMLNHEKEIYASQIRYKKLVLLFLGVLSITILAFLFTIKNREKQNLIEQEKLLDQVKFLKKKLSVQSVAAPISDKTSLNLNRKIIEKAINTKIGESSWIILNLIFNNPSISNKEIAEEVSLSLEGVSSSLRRMYQAFDIKTSSNKKITLIMKATRLSFEN